MRVVFDIDDTLYQCRRVPPGGQFPDYGLIQVLQWFAFNGDEVYVWSAGGVEYARQIVERLGLENLVIVIPKVALNDASNPHRIDLAFDDCETKLAKVDVIVRRGLYDQTKVPGAEGSVRTEPPSGRTDGRSSV